jgi:hypothetical protein
MAGPHSKTIAVAGTHGTEVYLKVAFFEYDRDARPTYFSRYGTPPASCSTKAAISALVRASRRTPAMPISTLISFLEAAAESYAYDMRTGRGGDNTGLFSEAAVEWAYGVSDELALARAGLEAGVEQ